MLPKLYVIGDITQMMADRLQDHFTICYDNDITDKAAWLSDYGAEINYILTNGHDGVPAPVMASMPHVKLISNYGVGYDAINVDEARDRGIIVTHTPNVLNEEVATTALMLMIACYRDFNANEHHARSAAWETDGNAPLSRSADNRVVGIVGLGRIGEAIARKLAPFGAEILYHNRTEKQVPYRYHSDLTDMARQADVLIIATPGGAGTAKLINQEVLEALGPDGIFINVARGSVVDETALIAALSNGTLGAAGLDVFEGEPHIPEALRALNNVVLLPHIGSATIETRAAMGHLTIDNILQHKQAGTVYTPVPETRDLAILAE